jgi:hypothetical protein
MTSIPTSKGDITRHLTIVALVAAVLGTSDYLLAQGRVKQHGRATVEYRSPEVMAVAGYEYSQANHAGAWLLIDVAVQTTDPQVITREQISLITPDERRVPLASHEQYLDDRSVLTQLYQNAKVLRRPLSGYFTSPLVATVRFFSPGNQIIENTFVSHRDEIPAGELLFKSPDGAWPAGTYRLVLAHDKVKAELPIMLR